MKRTKASKQATQQATLALHTLGSDSYLVVNKTLLNMFGPNAAIFLSNLIDKYKYFLNTGKLCSDGSFHLTHRWQVEQTGMSEYEIQTCKRRLKEAGIITTQKKGIPAKEYYYIDWKKLVRDFTAENSKVRLRGQVLRNPQDKTPGILRAIYKDNKFNNNKVIKLHSLEFLLNYDELDLKEKTNHFIPHAQYLASIIKSQRDYKIDKTKIKSWANEIRKVYQTDGVPAKRIREALEWYEQNIGGMYIPVIFSGAAFRNKFPALEEAMVRQSRPKPKTNSTTFGKRTKGTQYRHRVDGTIKQNF